MKVLIVSAIVMTALAWTSVLFPLDSLRFLERLRDLLWTLVFRGCAITVVANNTIVLANVIRRRDGQLVWRADYSENRTEYMSAASIRLRLEWYVMNHNTPFNLRGVLWCSGHTGDEVDALRVATALADDRAA